MSASDLRKALDGERGSLDAYLEVCNESEIRADILALIEAAPSKREHFAAMAMQGFCANSECRQTPADVLASWALEQADALIAALAKVQS